MSSPDEPCVFDDPALAGLVDALTDGPSPAELAGERAVLAAYRELGPKPFAHGQQRRPLRESSAGRGARKLAIAGVVAGLAFGSAAAAAYADVVPGPIKDALHLSSRSPADHPAPSSSPTVAMHHGPKASSPASGGPQAEPPGPVTNPQSAKSAKSDKAAKGDRRAKASKSAKPAAAAKPAKSKRPGTPPGLLKPKHGKPHPASTKHLGAPSVV